MNNIDKLTSPFAIDDSYHHEFEEFIENMIPFSLDEVEDIEAHNCVERKVVNLCKESLWEMIQNRFQENSSEDGDEWEKVRLVFDETFSEDMISSFTEKMPTLWWPDGPAITIPRSEVLEYIKKHKIETE